jgi:hypothetical protein
MGTIFDNKKSIFKKSKALMTDGCCEVAESCCGVGAGLRGYKIFFIGDVTQEINNGSTFVEKIAPNDKWKFILETIPGNGPVTVTSIVITPAIIGLSINSTPFSVSDPGSGTICEANWSTSGVRIFSVSITTDSGNFSFNAQITVT